MATMEYGWTTGYTNWTISGSPALENAKIGFDYLTSHGFTTKSACGVLANLWAESGMNPGQWQHGYSIYSSSKLCGFGLGQWTPWTKYSAYIGSTTESAMSNSDNQLRYLVNNTGQWGHGYINKSGYSSYYGIQSIYFASLADYMVSNEDADDLAVAWAIQWERPNSKYLYPDNRRKYANIYYNYFHDYDPEQSEITGHNVTVVVEGYGTAKATPSASVDEGEKVTLTYIPSEGSVFTGWSVEKGDISISNNSFTMPDESVIIKASFIGGSAPVIPADIKKNKIIYYLRPLWTL